MYEGDRDAIEAEVEQIYLERPRNGNQYGIFTLRSDDKGGCSEVSMRATHVIGGLYIGVMEIDPDEYPWDEYYSLSEYALAEVTGDIRRNDASEENNGT